MRRRAFEKPLNRAVSGRTVIGAHLNSKLTARVAMGLSQEAMNARLFVLSSGLAAG
jgi:hypothetical protein